MANVVYNSFKGRYDGSIDWENDTIKVMLVTSDYAPNIDTHEFKGDITNEVSGTGYEAGGATLIDALITVDIGDDHAEYDGNDITWGTSSITARGAVVYKDTGTPATSPLVGYVDFGSDKTSVEGDFTIQWSADGIFTIQ